MWDSLIESVARHMIPAMVFVLLIAHVLVRGLVDLTRGLARERTRREVAAYVANGNMTPEQGERILIAKDPQS